MLKYHNGEDPNWFIIRFAIYEFRRNDDFCISLVDINYTSIRYITNSICAHMPFSSQGRQKSQPPAPIILGSYFNWQ